MPRKYFYLLPESVYQLPAWVARLIGIFTNFELISRPRKRYNTLADHKSCLANVKLSSILILERLDADKAVSYMSHSACVHVCVLWYILLLDAIHQWHYGDDGIALELSV